MRATILFGFLASLALRQASAGRLDTQGVKCGQKRCSSLEYCSPYDTHCRPCAEACNAENRNYQPTECLADCQEYLHDQRYALRGELNQKLDSALYSSQREDLLGEIRRLRTVVTVTAILTSFALLALLLLLGKTLLRWEKIRNALQKVFARSWLRKASKRKNGGGNKVQDDAEAGNGSACKRNGGLKLSMPTISGSVSQPASVSNNESTPNTTSTPLSRRHPSEDTTLDYAYDNPAMTPSPDAPQLRTKRESSF